MLEPDDMKCVGFGACSVGEECQTEATEQRNPFNFRTEVFHMHKDHQMFEDGDIQRHMYLQDLYTFSAEDATTLSVSELACHISGCSGTFSTLEDYEHHYNTLHRHVCCSCRRSLPSARLLDIHIQEWHDPLFTILAQRQDMYQCLVEGCGLKFSTSKHRKEHLIRIHKYPPDFRFDRGKKEKGAQELKRQQPKDDMAMDVVQDACDSEGTCDLMCNVSCSDQLEPGESMETQVLRDNGDGLPSSASTEDPSTDAQHGEEHRTALKPQYSYRVPSTVCFGHGSVRGFRGRRGRRK